LYRSPATSATNYQVFLNGKSIGFVWSRRILSYRGKEGWNRGLRLRDFHPAVWYYGKHYHERKTSSHRRRVAIDKLVREETTAHGKGERCAP
jgi:hypothetical protein